MYLEKGTIGLKRAIEVYIMYQQIDRAASLRTIENYTYRLYAFVRFMGEGHIITDINLEVCEKYRYHLMERKLDVRTVNYHLSALRSFITFVKIRGYPELDASMVELFKERKKEMTFMDEEEVRLMLDAPYLYISHPIIRLRDAAILSVLYSTGVRVTELIRIKLDDMNLAQKTIHIMGKGLKPRLVFLTDDALKKVEAYLAMRSDDNEHFIVSVSGFSMHKPLSRNAIEELVKYYAMKCGLAKRITPHTFRHSLATSLYRKGVHIIDIKEIMGHSSINTTQQYTHAEEHNLKKVHAIMNS